MKRVIILSYGILMFLSTRAQDFNFTDSTFTVGSRLTRGHIYNPNCQIDEKYIPFIDSLADFLLRNKRIEITVEFYADGHEMDEWEKDRQRICGRKRLSSLLATSYPKLNQDRIDYIFHGNGDPIYRKEEILQMKDRNEQIKAYRKNRRTVIAISSIDFSDE